MSEPYYSQRAHSVCVSLCMLDLTAAFDTIDHSLLLSRLQLQGRFGVEGILNVVRFLLVRADLLRCCGWTSHLGSSTSYAQFHKARFWAHCSLFCRPTAELADIAAEYEITLHAFADDNQLCVHCVPQQALSSAYKVKQCVEALAQWMAANRIKLNAAKSELMWSGTKNNLLKIPWRQRGFSAHICRQPHCCIQRRPCTRGVADVRPVYGQTRAAAVSAKCFLGSTP